MKHLMFLVFIGLSLPLLAQEEDLPFPSPSPLGTITQVVGNTEIGVSYERPAARGRKIYSGLVPWGKVWRTGAAYCTKLSFSRPVKIGGQSIPAGTFSLFTIPTPEQWLVILNRDTSLYGAYDYDQKLDVARFNTKPMVSSRYYESLTIDIDVVPDDAVMYISWTDVTVPISVETGTEGEVLAFIEGLKTSEDASENAYSWAASYLEFSDQDYELALQLADKALAKNPYAGWAANTKVAALVKMQRHEEAITVAETAKEAEKTRPYEKEEWRTQEIANWQRTIDELKRRESGN